MVQLILAFASLAGGPALSAENVPSYALPVLEEVRSVYAPLLAEEGGVLELEVKSESELVVASAHRDSLSSYRVVLHGGLLRSPRLTPDALRFVLCHELGHLLGGAPRRAPPMEWDGPVMPDGSSFISSEGQADYYASFVCFRRIVSGTDHRFAVQNREVHPRLQRTCRRSWGKNEDGVGQCVRAALAGLDMLNLVMVFPIGFGSPDRTESERTITESYPARQCRLDTVVAGAACVDAAPFRLDKADAQLHGCHAGAGARPRCWFAP
jgi:hypothetical protein